MLAVTVTAVTVVALDAGPPSMLRSGLLLLVFVAAIVQFRLLEDVRRRNGKLLAELRQEIRSDPLTGAANRLALRERTAGELDRASRSGASTAALSIDLDGFKPLNDTHGHAVGDAVLCEIATRLRWLSRGSDVVARPGGDEFLLLLPDADHAHAEAAAVRLLTAVAAPLATLPSQATGVGASIGVAVVDASAAGRPGAVENLFAAADEAMYRAKRGGRSTYRVAGVHRAGDGSELVVDTDEARQWSRYFRQLREEIDQRKSEGRLEPALRAPEGVHRTLMSLLAAVDALPSDHVAPLALPHREALEEFVFHTATLQHWIDAMQEQGVLATRMSPAADRFWRVLSRYALTERTGGRGDERTAVPRSS